MVENLQIRRKFRRFAVFFQRFILDLHVKKDIKRRLSYNILYIAGVI